MKKRPGTRPGRRSSKLFFGAYFVAAGAGVEAVVASVFVVSLLVAPLFFVTFLCVTFFFVVLAGDLVFASCAKATPSDRMATATRAERVFFIFFSNPLFLWPVRGLPTKQSAQPRCHTCDRRRAKAISCFIRMG